VVRCVGARALLTSVSRERAEGEYIAVVGDSGIGKSTLLNVIAGLEPVDAGKVEFEDRELTAMDDDARSILRRDKFGFVFQAFHILPNLTVAQNVALPLLLRNLSNHEKNRSIISAFGLVCR